MSEDKEQSREGGQDPITHEGADPDARLDSNEDADGRVRIEQPSGDEAPSS
jgi:hypothetical protein